MNIIDAIRKICEKENGFFDLFKPESLQEFITLTNDQRSVNLMTKLFHGSARSYLIELIKHAYDYKKYIDIIISSLVKDGLTIVEANQAITVFLTAFGFPEYRSNNNNSIKEFVSYQSNDFKTIYKGETINGKEYGLGIRYSYFENNPCGTDECVWIDGRMFGYNYATEIELQAYEVRKIGFVIDDYFYGKTKYFYDDGDVEYLDSKPLDIK